MRKALWGAAVVWALILAPAVAFAQEHGGHEGGGDPVQVDLWQAAFTIVVFVILVVILGRFAFKPILSGLQKREEFIRKSFEDAEQAAKDAQAKLAEYSAKLEAARTEANAIVEEARRDADVVKHTEQDRARKEADAMIDRARREIDIARDTAVRELYTLGAKLATDAAGRIIKKELSPADHERLIQESIESLSRGASQNN